MNKKVRSIGPGRCHPKKSGSNAIAFSCQFIQFPLECQARNEKLQKNNKKIPIYGVIKINN